MIELKQIEIERYDGEVFVVDAKYCAGSLEVVRATLDGECVEDFILTRDESLRLMDRVHYEMESRSDRDLGTY